MKNRIALFAVAAALTVATVACGGSSDDADGTGALPGETSTTAATEAPTTPGESATTVATEAPAGLEGELSTIIQGGFEVDASLANCVAGELTGALPEETLEAYVESQQDELPPEDTAAVEAAVREAFAACP